MTEGIFWMSFTQSISLLKRLNLFKQENSHKRIPDSEECRAYSRGKDYKSLYQPLVDNRDYDILLYDDSMLQMSFEDNEYRLLYIQNPQEFLSFESFLAENGCSDLTEDRDELYEMFYDDYEQTLEGMKMNSGAVYLRYDVDSRGRKNNENIHAYTHLHVGLNNNVRIPVGRYMTPLAFTVFVIRHVYYDKWVEAVRNTLLSFNHKTQCGDLPNDLWTPTEMNDFYLY
jgi:hypothetical protein